MRVELYGNDIAILERWRDALRPFDPIVVDSLAAKGGPKVVVVDFDSASETVRRFLKKAPRRVRVVVLEGAPSVERGKTLIMAGAKGYGNSYMRPRNLKACLDSVISGHIWLYPEFVSALVGELLDRKTVVPPSDLTKRQKELVPLLLEGLSNKEIAQKLGITERTVKAHLTNIYEKLGVSNRFELAVRLKGE